MTQKTSQHSQAIPDLLHSLFASSEAQALAAHPDFSKVMADPAVAKGMEKLSTMMADATLSGGIGMYGGAGDRMRKIAIETQMEGGSSGAATTNASPSDAEQRLEELNKIAEESRKNLDKPDATPIVELPQKSPLDKIHDLVFGIQPTARQ